MKWCARYATIHSYLEESEAVVAVDDGGEAAVAKFHAEKFQARGLQRYFVHEEVDKQTELDLNHFSLGDDETNMLYVARRLLNDSS